MAIFRSWKNPDTRERYAARLRQIAEDAPDRAERLSPVAVQYWTDVVTSAAKLVQKGERPCATAPWRTALETHLAGRPPDTVPPLERAREIAGLTTMSYDIAKPSWPDPRRDLIEFTLAYLEGDVMLFRSGSTKKYLIRRLQQAPLTDDDIARVETLLRRAVTDGTGLEEYRVFCKLAFRLVVVGHLPDFKDWLFGQAQGAILTGEITGSHEWYDLPQRGLMSKQDFAKLGKYGWSGPKWGLVYPAMTEVVDARRKSLTPQDKARRNAYRMLAYIENAQIDSASIKHFPQGVTSRKLIPMTQIQTRTIIRRRR